MKAFPYSNKNRTNAGHLVLIHIAAVPHRGHAQQAFLLKAQLLIEADGLLVVGKDLQLHPHQHEPVVDVYKRQTSACPTARREEVSRPLSKMSWDMGMPYSRAME